MTICMTLTMTVTLIDSVNVNVSMSVSLSTVLEESSSGDLKKGAQELKRAQYPGGTKVPQVPTGTKVSWVDVTRESRQPSTSSNRN